MDAILKAHTLARIVEQVRDSRDGFRNAKPVSTKGWARLDSRTKGNVWGLSVSDVPPLEDHALLWD